MLMSYNKNIAQYIISKTKYKVDPNFIAPPLQFLLFISSNVFSFFIKVFGRTGEKVVPRKKRRRNRKKLKYQWQ